MHWCLTWRGINRRAFGRKWHPPTRCLLSGRSLIVSELQAPWLSLYPNRCFLKVHLHWKFSALWKTQSRRSCTRRCCTRCYRPWGRDGWFFVDGTLQLRWWFVSKWKQLHIKGFFLRFLFFPEASRFRRIQWPLIWGHGFQSIRSISGDWDCWSASWFWTLPWQVVSWWLWSWRFVRFRCCANWVPWWRRIC